VILKLSLPSVGKKALGKELLRRVFSFTEGFLRGTRQRTTLPSARKKHSAKNLALGKEPNSGSIEQILKVMTESLPTKLLSPLGPQLTKLLQKDEPSAAKKAVGPKKRRIVTVMQAIEKRPPPASA
jgi:hypothetical protein